MKWGYLVATVFCLAQVSCDSDDNIPSLPSCFDQLKAQAGETEDCNNFLDLYKFNDSYVYVYVADCEQFQIYIFNEDCQIISIFNLVGENPVIDGKNFYQNARFINTVWRD